MPKWWNCHRIFKNARMKLKQVLLDHKLHKLSRGFCFQKLNPNIFQSKFDFSCSTAGFQCVAAGDRRKITKMTVESWKMVGFHFLKKEKKLQIEPDRMSYRNPGVKWIFGGQNWTFVLNLRLPEMSKISGFSWKSRDTDLHCPNDAGSRATLATERYHMSMVAF